MLTKRKANDRGSIKLDWLFARHSFSFGSYVDPDWMGFRSLRVINEDVIQPGQGFGMHGHSDMEIMTFIIDGELEHQDNMGNRAIIKPGDIQIMSAGSGVMHSEFNPSKTKETHLLQIWIEPSSIGIKPRYEQYKFKEQENILIPLINEDGGKNIAKVYQEASISYGLFNEASELKLNMSKHYWIQVIKGSGVLNDHDFENGDAFALSQERSIQLDTTAETKFLFFELA